MLHVQAYVNYDELICHLVNYQGQMATQNVSLQAQLCQLTR